MAKRSREHRQEIPGYDESRPSRDERRQQHRTARHTTNQMLHMADDLDDVVLPEAKRTRKPENGDVQHHDPEKRRFKLWKTKFWKRRDDYRDEKAALDSQWPVITPSQLPEE